MSEIYRQAGVDIDAAQEALGMAHSSLSKVSEHFGAFAQSIDARQLVNLDSPRLVATTDGVGTKAVLALATGRVDGLGFDLINHGINDLLTTGAKPLFAVDYIGVPQIAPEQVSRIVESVVAACCAHQLPLLGGELAEMRAVYKTGAIDLVATLVGVVEANSQLGSEIVRKGDCLIALPSNGLHTNGYSIINHHFSPHELDLEFDGINVLDTLLLPHRTYLQELKDCRQSGIEVHALAHITGGGLVDNISRILPSHLSAVIDTQTWTVPAIFRWLMSQTKMDFQEAIRVLNLGVGMVISAAPTAFEDIQQVAKDAWKIGEITDRKNRAVEIKGFL